MSIIIVKDTIGSPHLIEELGIEVPGSGQIILSDYFSKTEISESDDLKSKVSSGDFIVNDGTSDLSITDGLRHINLETEYEDIDGSGIGPHNISDHLDIEGTPTDEDSLAYDSASGKWKPEAKPVLSTTEPPIEQPGTVWVEQTTSEPYIYNETSSSWLSISKNYISFTRDKKIDGAYLEVGDKASQQYYLINDATLLSIYFKAEKGTADKHIEVKKNGTMVYEFDLVDHEFLNKDLSINFSSGDYIGIFVTKGGGNIEGCICQAEIAWRFDTP